MLRRDLRVLVFGAGVAAFGVVMSEALARMTVRAWSGAARKAGT